MQEKKEKRATINPDRWGATSLLVTITWTVKESVVTSTLGLSAGVMGVVEMDEFGDREMDFAVWDMTDLETGEFQVKHLTHAALWYNNSVMS